MSRCYSARGRVHVNPARRTRIMEESDRMTRRVCVLVLLLGVLAGFGAGTPAASAMTVPGPGAPFRVLILDHMAGWQLRKLAKRGAVGLLVPGEGPTTNQGHALAQLVRGAEVNSYLGGVPEAPRVIWPQLATGTPSGVRLIVVTLPPKGKLVANDKRYYVVVLGGGAHGLLLSKTTRIPGLVSIVDIAPTALGWSNGALTWTPSKKPIATLKQLNAQIHGNNRLKLAFLIVIACWILLFTLVLPRAAVTAVPAGLLTSIVIGAAHITNEVAIMTAFVIGMVGGALWLARLCRSDGRLLALIVAVLLLHFWLLAARPEWIAVTPLGPTQVSRFWGIGNQLETLLLAPLLAGAAIAARRFGVVGFVLFAFLGLMLVTDNRFGSDGGGAIVVGVALAFLGARVLRLGPRGFLTLLLLSATAVLAIVWRDLQRPGPYHLRSAFGHGVSGLVSVAENRVPLSYEPAVHNWPLVLPFALWFALALAIALWRQRRPGSRDLVFALALAIGTSLLVNDSAAYELCAGVAALGAVVRFVPTIEPLRIRALAREPVAVPSETD
jgi:hypothetical protein